MVDISFMKRLLLTTVLAFLFVGCGSSTVKSGDVDLTQSQPSSTLPSGFKGYVFYDYLLPSTDKVVQSYKYKNDTFLNEESLEYTKSAARVIERSLKNRGGQVEYQDGGDGTIKVTIYNNASTEYFTMKNFVNIGDIITVKKSTCRVSAYHDKLSFGEKNFTDVLEVRCPDSVGYYQKGQGLVVENDIDTSLQANSIDPDTYTQRSIGIIDRYQPKDSRFSSYNLSSAIEAQADKLWAAPYNLNGQGVKIGLVDEGSVLDTHVELRGRVTNLSNEDTSLHATHVAGTLISAGTHLATSHGFANQAEVYMLSYHDVYFADSIKKLANDYDVLISNHSYGYEDPTGFGEYDRESRELDSAVRENPYMIAVMAAGNDGDEFRNDSRYPEWGLIKGGSNAKNVITVAAIDNESNHISSFSSRGPIKGGRLKPDIATDGANVLSTSNYDNTAYKRMYGTSMASPAATGSIALLAQRYKQVMGTNIRLDTMKAILFNTAVDIENPGPDYKSGFGNLDALAAVQVIDTMASQEEALVKLDTIHQGENQRYFINSTRYENFKVTLAWVDDVYKACNDCANDILMNDIDMYLVEEESGKKIYPYTLSENNPRADAREDRENHIDPQEQISYRLKVGNYTLHINGHKIDASGQNFTLVTSQALSEVQKDIVVTPMNEHIHKIYNAIE